MKSSLVVRLGGDSSSLEKALESARKSIRDMGNEAVTKLNDIQKGFDKTQSSTAPLARRIRDIKKQMEIMAVSGIDATEEGNEMWQKLSEAAKEYDEMLKRIQADTRKVGEESSNVPSLPSSSEGGGGSLLDGVDFKEVGGDLLKKSGLGGVAPALGAIAGAINPVTVGITAIDGTMIAAGKATAEFETHLNSLQALTGLTDDEMKGVSDGAIEMSKSFKSSAGEIVDAMKLIGSQAPELLSNSDALMEVTKAANVLSEAAEIGVEDAAKAITGTMNQMGASASEATNIINTFAAASQQGSADVAYLNKAFEKSGTAASSAGMDYVQLASAIESVAPKFSSADVAGSQLASTLLKLSMSGNNDFMPSVVGMSKALENLAKAEMDDVTMKNLVGESNITMLKSLIDAREQFDSYNESLRGTNTAFEQMETNQKGFNGAINKMKSAWEAFLLTLGQSGIMQGITDNIVAVIDAVNDIINVVSDVIKSFEAFGDTGIETVNGFKIQLGWLVDAIKMVGTVVEVVVRLIAKAFNSIIDAIKYVADGVKYHWDNAKKALMDIGFVRTIVNAFNKVIDGAAKMCDAIKKYWNKLKEFLGMKVDANVETKTTTIDSNVVNNTTNNATNTSSTSSSKESKSKKSKSTKTEKIDYLVSVDDKTLDTAEKKLRAFQNKKKTIKIDDVEGLKECDEQIKKWQNEVIKRKLIIEFGNDIFNTLNDLQSQLNALEGQKREIEVAINKKESSVSLNKEIEDISKNIESLEEQKRKIQIEVESDIEELNAIEASLNALESREIELSVNGSSEEIEAIRSEIKTLQDKKVELSFNISSNKEEIGRIKEEVDSLNGKKLNISVTASTKELEEIDNRLNALKSKEIEIKANGSIEELDAIRDEITSLTKQRYYVSLAVDADSSKVDELNKKIEEVKNNILIESIKIGFVPEIEKGSKTDIENEIKKLEDVKKILFQTNTDPETVKKVDDEIKTLKKNLESEEIRLGIKPKVEDGSLNAIKKKIEEKEKEIALALNTNINPESMKKLQSELDALRKQEEAKEIEIGVKVNTPTVHKEDKKFERGSVEDKKQSLDNANSMVKEIQTNYKLGLIGADEVKSQISEINSQLESIGLKPITLTFNDDGTLTTAIEDLDRMKEKMGATSDIIGNMGNAFSSLGSAIGGTEGNIVSFAGQSMNAIAQIIPQIVTLITAKQAEAMASGVASGAELPFPANIAAMASILATVVGLFASLPKFEKGGIVGGTSYTGDKLLARVNSGEGVLTRNGIKNLQSLYDTAGIGQVQTNNVNVSGQLKVSGTDLKAVLSNYDKKMGRIK